MRGSPGRDISFLGAGGEGTRTGPWWSCAAAVVVVARLGGGRWNQHFGTFNGPKQMLDAPLCREFRSETDASSEIIQIKAKMKVGWKSLNSQRQAENFSKKWLAGKGIDYLSTRLVGQ